MGPVSRLLGPEVAPPQLVSMACAPAPTFRDSDKRGVANGARIRLASQRDWPVNDPAGLVQVLGTLERIHADSTASQSGDKAVSLAGLIVPGGCAGVEAAADETRPHVIRIMHPATLDDRLIRGLQDPRAPHSAPRPGVARVEPGLVEAGFAGSDEKPLANYQGLGELIETTRNMRLVGVPTIEGIDEGFVQRVVG
jgi:hypothetical protein